MTHHNDTAQTHQRSGWLWVSAGVLASLILVQGAGMLDSTAHAEMSSTSGAYTMITTDGGNDAVKMYGRQTNRSVSNLGWLETQKPPTVPTDLEKVPTTKSTSSATPAAS